MIEGLKEHQISLNKGIVRTPSLGEEGELSECVNLIPRNGEMQNIPEPEDIGVELPEGAELLASHETSNFKHYIYGKVVIPPNTTEEENGTTEGKEPITGVLRLSNYVYDTGYNSGNLFITREDPIVSILTEELYNSFKSVHYYMLKPVYLKAGQALSFGITKLAEEKTWNCFGYVEHYSETLYQGMGLSNITHKIVPFSVEMGELGVASRDNIIPSKNRDRWVYVVIDTMTGSSYLTYNELANIKMTYQLWDTPPYRKSTPSGLLLGIRDNGFEIEQLTEDKYPYLNEESKAVYQGYVLGTPVQVKAGARVCAALDYLQRLVSNKEDDAYLGYADYVYSKTELKVGDTLPNNALSSGVMTVLEDCYIYPKISVWWEVWGGGILDLHRIDYVIPYNDLYSKGAYVLSTSLGEEGGVTPEEEGNYELHWLADGRDSLVGVINSNSTPKVTTIGNTLITSTDEGMRYYLFQDKKYRILGNRLPEPKIKAVLATGYAQLSAFSYDCICDCYEQTGRGEIYGGQQEGREYDFGLRAMAAINKLENFVKADGFFSYPFFIRYGLQLSDADSSIANLSSPILMMPSHFGEPCLKILSGTPPVNSHAVSTELRVAPCIHRDRFTIELTNPEDFEGWEDVISNIVVYASEQIQTYKEDAQFKEAFFRRMDVWKEKEPEAYDKYKARWGELCKDAEAVIAIPGKYNASLLEAYNSEEDGSMPVFKLRSIPINKTTSAERTRYNVPKLQGTFAPYVYTYPYPATVDKEGSVTDPAVVTYDLLNLSAQAQIDWSKASEMGTEGVLSPSLTYVYNGRLILANVHFYSPLTASSCWFSQDKGGGTRAVVLIKYEEGHRYVEIEEFRYSGVLHYFFYPDRRASNLYVSTGTEWLDYPLQKSDMLGGAYYFSGVVRSNYIPTHSGEVDYFATNFPFADEMADINRVEENPEWWDKDINKRLIKNDGRVFVSLLGSPFSFPKANRVTVVSTNIKAMAAATQALSTGQFGQYPLYALTSEGVYALTISSTGLIEATNPVSRDVISESGRLLQLDNALVFPTKQGLMMLSGGEVKCISAKVDGYNIDEEAFDQELIVPDTLPFVQQIQSCLMAYDYASQTIHIYTDDKSKGGDLYKHYVYSLESGQWSSQVLAKPLTTSVATYPLTTLQYGRKLYRYRMGVDASHVRKGGLITRPLAFGNPVVRKMLYDLRVIGQKTLATSYYKVRVYISEDRRKWYRLRSLKSQSAKWYRFYIETDMCDIDTLSGIICQTVERYTGKMR